MFRRTAAIAALLFTAGSVFGADFTGKFRAPNDAMVIELKSAGADQYTGTVSAGDQTCNLTATAKDQKISGKFTTGGNSFTLDGTLDGDQLTVTTGGATYVMTRPAAAGANPFGAGSAAATKARTGGDAPKPADAAAAPDAAAEVIPPDGKVLAVTPSGKTLFFVFPDAKDAATGIRAVVGPINKRLGTNVTLGKAFADTKNPACGSGSFTVTVGADNYTGTILCGPAKTGEAVSVVYMKKGASTPGDFATLMNALPTVVETETYNYPDGSGSIEIPKGWTVKNKTLADPLFVTGPNHQVLLMGLGIGVQAPDSPLMKMYAQNVAFAKAHHFAPPPPMKGIFVAPFDKPSVAVKVLDPQLSASSREQGLPYSEDPQVTEAKDLPNQLPDGKAEAITGTSTLVDGEVRTKMRNVQRLEAVPSGPGAWMLWVGLSMGAEQDRFPGDSVTMLGIIKSIKPNQKVLAQIFEDRIEANREMNEAQREAARERFKAGQIAHEDQLKGYDEYNKNWRDQQIVKDKSAKDYIEYIRGYRTVEDTQTGKTTDVDLSNVKQTMDDLNQADPGRYKEIPLRDQ
jgi:hypothetical protein